MQKTPPPEDSRDADEASSREFRLLVWTSPSCSWRARIVGADAFERDFASPFELARFLAWPVTTTGTRGPGLR